MTKFHSPVVVPRSSSLQGKQEPHLKKEEAETPTTISNFEQVASSLFLKPPSQKQKQGLPSSCFRATSHPPTPFGVQVQVLIVVRWDGELILECVESRDWCGMSEV